VASSFCFRLAIRGKLHFSITLPGSKFILKWLCNRVLQNPICWFKNAVFYVDAAGVLLKIPQKMGVDEYWKGMKAVAVSRENPW